MLLPAGSWKNHGCLLVSLKTRRTYQYVRHCFETLRKHYIFRASGGAILGTRLHLWKQFPIKNYSRLQRNDFRYTEIQRTKGDTIIHVCKSEWDTFPPHPALILSSPASPALQDKANHPLEQKISLLSFCVLKLLVWKNGISVEKTCRVPPREGS